MVKRELHVVNGELPTENFVSFLVGFIKDLGFSQNHFEIGQ